MKWVTLSVNHWTKFSEPIQQDHTHREQPFRDKQ